MASENEVVNPETTNTSVNAAPDTSANVASDSSACTEASPVEFPCEKEGVLKLLPHRDPFVGSVAYCRVSLGKSVVVRAGC